ncbi:MAG: hypothetical protein IH971_02090 [Candidatus Marinimicrobia bacterium]|nr:hypothetical protein [Candidatus Neomarinimicrobiota bacterium]
MKESLALLIKLQAVDSELMEIEEQKGDLPAQVERLSDELDELAKGAAAKRVRLEEIEHESNQLQGTLEDTRGQLKKYQEQLLLVATNRAYDALSAEIDGAKKSVDEGEFHALELIEERQRLTDELKSDELLAEQKRVDLDTQKKSLKSTVAANDERSTALSKERNQIQPQIESRYMGAYERISAAREGRAVVPISRGACGVCFHRIPPQQQVEIKAMDRIVTCDSCGVILYWAEE